MGKQPGRPSLGHRGEKLPVSCTLTSPWGPSSVFPSEPLPVPGPIRCSKQALDLFILPCPQPAGNTCCHLLRSMGGTDQTQQRNGHSYDFLFVSLDTSHFRGHPSFAHIDIFLTILPVLFICSHSSLPNLSVQTSLGLPFHDCLSSASSYAPPQGHQGVLTLVHLELGSILSPLLSHPRPCFPWWIPLFRVTSPSPLCVTAQVLLVRHPYVPGRGTACCPTPSPRQQLERVYQVSAFWTWKQTPRPDSSPSSHHGDPTKILTLLSPCPPVPQCSLPPSSSFYSSCSGLTSRTGSQNSLHLQGLLMLFLTMGPLSVQNCSGLLLVRSRVRSECG